MPRGPGRKTKQRVRQNGGVYRDEKDGGGIEERRI